MAEEALHKSRNSIFWKADQTLLDLHRDKSWRDFHKAAGKQGLYFDSINKHGNGYTLLAFRVRKRAREDFYDRFTVSEGRGRDPKAAVRDAFIKARAAGFEIDADLIDIIDGSGSDDEIAALLGGESTPDLDDEIAALLG